MLARSVAKYNKCIQLTYSTQAKPNFGHSEGTSGLTSLIKAILSLEKKTLLPHIHMREPNPNSRACCVKVRRAS